MQRYLNETQAAEHANVSAKYLKKLRCVGGGPEFIKVGGGRRVIYDVDDIDTWLGAQKVRSTSEATQRKASAGAAAA